MFNSSPEGKEGPLNTVEWLDVGCVLRGEGLMAGSPMVPNGDWALWVCGFLEAWAPFVRYLQSDASAGLFF